MQFTIGSPKIGFTFGVHFSRCSFGWALLKYPNPFQNKTNWGYRYVFKRA